MILSGYKKNDYTIHSDEFYFTSLFDVKIHSSIRNTEKKNRILEKALRGFKLISIEKQRIKYLSGTRDNLKFYTDSYRNVIDHYVHDT